jgi:translocation and assembly module TamA
VRHVYGTKFLGWLFMALSVLLKPAGPALADLPYKVEFSVLGDSELLETLKDASLLRAEENRPPPTESALRRRVDRDAEQLRNVIRSEGYYDAVLDAEIDLDAIPARVLIAVEPGPRYSLANVSLVGPSGGALEGVDLSLKEIGLELGAPARSAAVFSAEQKTTLRLAEQGYPLARVPDRKVIVDHKSRTMSVTYVVDPGPRADFGEPRISGNRDVETSYIENRLSWRRGSRFDLRELEETRKRLIRSELFNSVKLVPADAVGPDGTIAILIEVAERKSRSVSAGVNWSSSEGFGVEASWEHRNMAGHGESLKTTATLSQVLIGANAFLRLPDAVRRDLDVVGTAAIEREDTEAFTSERIATSAGLEQRFSSSLSVGLSLSLALEKDDDDDGEDTFTLIGLPGYLRYDGTDDLLDPTEGGRASVFVTPYYALFAETDSFLRSEAIGSAYYAIDEDARYVLAARGRLGSIWGAGREELPASVRFYAGGGGSIRGYGFQQVGPLDEDNDPLGGRSVIEFGGEMRVRITDTIGIVPFIEGGNVYVDMLPEATDFDFRYGAGVGLRYYTAIGPLRLDVAVPLDRRETDDAFQFYISLGQAF